jgi:NAD/NADP transhydrogenase beta subunit
MENFAGFAYIVASILFILSIRGLSHPETARRGNQFGIAGMVVAIVTTLLLPNVMSYWMIILGIAIGGSIGYVIAKKIDMTALPQLVAGFHSLVGLAAVLVAMAAFYAPEAYGLGTRGNIPGVSLVEMANWYRDWCFDLYRFLCCLCQAAGVGVR